MARSIKRGLNYFSVDVGLFADRKVKRVIHACGAEAVAVLLKIWCLVYDEHGYYAAPDGDFFFDVSSELGVDEVYVKSVLDKSIEAGLFDSELYGRFGILTSRRIQSNFIDATRKRVKNNTIAEEHLLLDGECLPPDDTYLPSGGICLPSGGICLPSGGESTQSKVKQSKVEESKQEHGGGGGLLSFGECVRMKADEYDELVKQYGESGAKRMTEMLRLYKASTGKAYASDYHAILSWVVKRWKEENPGRESFERPIGNYDHLALDLFADDS